MNLLFTGFNRFFVALIITALVLMLSGCSRLDMAVNWADSYITSLVDDYFDLTSKQNKQLKESLNADIEKIRQEQFPSWAAILRRMDQELSKNSISEQIVKKYFIEVLELGRKLPSYFEDTALIFAESLSKEQMNYFDEEIEKKNTKDEKKLKNQETALDENRKKYQRAIEMWTGSLNRAQELVLEKHLKDHKFPLREQIKNKKELQKKFREARESVIDLKKFIKSYYVDNNRIVDADYGKALTAYQADLQTYLFQLVKSLSEKQKKIFSENLIEKATALEELAVKKVGYFSGGSESYLITKLTAKGDSSHRDVLVESGRIDVSSNARTHGAFEPRIADRVVGILAKVFNLGSQAMIEAAEKLVATA
jgi:hypothetical protein